MNGPSMSGSDAERWRRIEDLFHQALEQPAGERERWLQSACQDDAALLQEVLSLLHADSSSTASVQGNVAQAVRDVAEELEQRAVLRLPIGPYRLLRQVGRGGMGTVYRAERADGEFHKHVAIKLVRPGWDTDFILARFRRERQILARLEHPNIARMLDGGTAADGQPYLVMEFVDGEKLTEHCRRRACSLEQVLDLFLQVCAALQYAHQNFVVHRDVKPGNILVDAEGVPKLLDFGISKLLHSEVALEGSATQEMCWFTPDYASPEQVAGGTATAVSDVYSLAAVLYELLTGAVPHDLQKLPAQEAMDRVCNAAVELPSRRAAGRQPGTWLPASPSRLKGDLDNILLKALQKVPARRYQSVQDLAEDVRRYLRCRPVRARPDSVFYRGGKFARRHRAAMALALVLFLALLGGAGYVLRQAHHAAQHAREDRALARAFIFDVESALRDVPGTTRSRELILATGVDYLDRLAARSEGDPEMEQELAEAYIRIADVQGNVLAANLGKQEAALHSYAKALVLLEQVLRRRPEDAVATRAAMEAHRKMGNLHAHRQGNARALQSYRRAAALGESLLARDSRDEAARQEMAALYLATSRAQRLADDPAALGAAERALTALQSLSPPLAQTPEVQALFSSAHSAVGMLLVRGGDVDGAVAHYRQAIQFVEALVEAEPGNANHLRQLMLAYGHLGDGLRAPRAGAPLDPAGALAAYEQAAAIARRLHQSDPSDQRAFSDYAIALMRFGRAMGPEMRRRKQETLAQALEVMEDIVRRDPKNSPILQNLGAVQQELAEFRRNIGDAAGAVAMYKASLHTADRFHQLDPSLTGYPRLVVYNCSGLGPLAVRRGDTVAVADCVQRLETLAEKMAAEHHERHLLTWRVVLPRACTALGEIHLALAEQAAAEAQRRHLQAAVQWKKRAVAAYAALTSYENFARDYGREAEQEQTSLRGLEEKIYAYR